MEYRRYLNPVKATQAVKADDVDVQIFTPTEMRKLLAAASNEFLPRIVLGAFAGLRSAEIKRLTWDDIRLVGIHAAAPAVLHAAALDDRVQQTTLQQSPVNSWADDVVAKPLRSDMVDHVVPGALRWYDLSDLEFTLKDRLWK